MPTLDQDDVIAFLQSEAAFGPATADVRTIITHISIVLLIGERAIKLKRAVTLPYVDLSAPERRWEICQQEVRLNRRTAPTLYRAARRVTREADGRLTLDGDGALVDAIVEMVRFDEDGLFDKMARQDRLTPTLMTKLAYQIALFHKAAAVDGRRGGADAITAVLDVNERSFALSDVFAQEEVKQFNDAFRNALASHTALLDSRAKAGKIRRGHGDLHLRNICLVADEPTMFDCLEFDEDLGTTDILYDLAFLLMDLWHRDMKGFANIVFNRYFDILDEEEGLPLLPFFIALRAAVRAHVLATQAKDADTPGPAAEARAYFDLATDLLRRRNPRLVAVGGLSGSGKSTVAAALAPIVGPAPGGRILASDRLRKELFGVDAHSRLPQESYHAEVSARVYAQLAERAARLLRRGHGVVADAVFDRPTDRQRIALVAAKASVAFRGIWLQAPPAQLLQRVAARKGDVSDATPEVVRAQLQRSPGDIDWTILPATADAATVGEMARHAIMD